MPGYIRYDADGVEVIPAGEEAYIKTVVDQVNFIQQAQRCPRSGATRLVQEPNSLETTFTGTHAKTHGIVKGTMTVGNLPVAFAQSMFATPGTYPIAMRYSSEPGVPNLDDRIPQPRGLGLKVFNVQGKKLSGDGTNQDFEFNSCSILELGSAKTASEIIDLRIKHGDPDALSAALHERDDGVIQHIRTTIDNQRVESQTQHSQSAYRFGDYVAKFALVATGAKQVANATQFVTSADHSSILREWMHDFFATNDGTFELRAQLLENLADQHIEDSRHEWDPVKYPFVTIATINIPAQETMDKERVDFWHNHLRVDCWKNALETLKPLGSINRLRKDVYAASFKFRHLANGQDEVVVESLEQIP